MTTNHERASFGAALRDAAESFSVPRVEDLHELAVRRGRQIRRRKAAGRGVSAAVAIVAMGALTASLLGSGTPNRQSAVSPTPTPTGAHKSVPPIRPGLGRYMAEHLLALLPPGARLDTGTGLSALNGSGYSIMGSNGIWAAFAQAFVMYGGQRYQIVVQVNRQWLSRTCATLPPMDGPCTSKPLGRGTLVSTAGTLGPSTTQWSDYWNLADGASVELDVRPADSAATRNLYTEKQIESFVTAPAWTSVLDGLPQVVHCGDLEPQNGENSVQGWLCVPTGKMYPDQLADVYTTKD